MQRNLEALSASRHDLLVVGGGIAGAWIAWEAALSGLKVALIDKGDFCGATSANSSTILHGGLRYLQQADLPRMRISINERRILLSVAPHLTRPLPCAIPTYRELKHSRTTLRAGLALADCIGFDRNKGLSSSRRLGAGRLLDMDELAIAVPGLERSSVTGGALWCDGQVTAPARLVLAILQSASDKGVALANYVEASAPILTATAHGQSVTGVAARNLLSGQCFQIDARMVVDATGPWAGHLAARVPGVGARHLPPLCGAMNLVVRRPSVDRRSHSQTALGGRMSDGRGGTRFLFGVPWQEHLFLGTRYFAHDGAADRFTVSESDVTELLEWISQAFPNLGIKRADVSHVQAGLLPAERRAPDGEEPTPIRHHRIIEHRETDEVTGLITVITEKLTTARYVAEQVVGRVLSSLRGIGPSGQSARLPVFGGDMDDVSRFVDEAAACPVFANVPQETARGFAAHYGSAFRQVLEHLPESSRQPNEAALLSAGAAYAVRHEMAETLPDVVLRRTYRGGADIPPHTVLGVMARRMGLERGWDDERIAAEIAAVHTPVYMEKG